MHPGELLVEAARGAHEVVLIAPYMKERTLRSLIEHFDRDAALTCVTRWLPGDIDAGVSDIAVQAIRAEPWWAFRLHASLHAKYYRFDDEVFVGSVNVTASGVWLGGTPQCRDSLPTWKRLRSCAV